MKKGDLVLVKDSGWTHTTYYTLAMKSEHAYMWVSGDSPEDCSHGIIVSVHRTDQGNIYGVLIDYKYYLINQLGLKKVKRRGDIE